MREASSLRRRVPRLWVPAGIAVVVAGLGLAALTVLPGISQALRPSSCPVPTEHDPEVIKTVYEVGTAREVSDKLMHAAFAAGWVESHMQNLPCGDRDSLGVFQQRPSQDWGTPDQIMNVEYAATQFFDRAERLEAIEPELTAGDLAQRVQRSAYPDRYGRAEAKARLLQLEAERLALSPSPG